MVLQIGFFSKLNLSNSLHKQTYFFTRSTWRHIPLQKELSCFEIQKETRRVPVQSSKYFLEKCSIAFLAVFNFVTASSAQRQHTPPLKNTQLITLALALSEGSSVQVLAKFMCIHHLACRVSYDLHHRFCFDYSKKNNCCSLLSSICGVTASSNFSKVLLNLNRRVL